MMAGVAGLALAMAMLSGCGGSPSSSTVTPNQGTSPGSLAPGHSAPTVSSAHGLVVCQLISNNTAIDVAVMSPRNLQVEASAVIPAVPDQEETNDLTSGPNAPLGCGSGQSIGYISNTNIPSIGPEQFAARQEFNAAFTKIAVLIQNPSSGTADAGYIDLATGKVTDVTGAGGSGFGSSTANVNDALYDPATGDLWFLTTNGTPYSVGASGQATAHPVSYASSMQCCSADTPGHIALAPRTGWVLSVNDAALPNPSGTVAVGPGPAGSGQIEVWRQGSDVSQTTTGTAITAQGMQTQTLATLEPIGWLNNTRLVMVSGSQFYIVTFGPGYTSATAGPGLLPSNSYLFLQAMLSPDHHTLAFIVNKGGADNYLYELALNQPGAQPAQVGPLGSSSAPWAILAWR
jgi:hypothetical protein